MTRLFASRLTNRLGKVGIGKRLVERINALVDIRAIEHVCTTVAPEHGLDFGAGIPVADAQSNDRSIVAVRKGELDVGQR